MHLLRATGLGASDGISVKSTRPNGVITSITGTRVETLKQGHSYRTARLCEEAEQPLYIPVPDIIPVFLNLCAWTLNSRRDR
jgi:hypothetical protein